jgi:parallel beta-helix repeat protein
MLYLNMLGGNIMTVRIVPAQFTSINEAIAASAPGDTVRILFGTFNESVTVPAGKDRLTIIGVWPRVTTITSTVGPIFTINSNLVTIQNLTAQGATNSSGIVLASDSNVIRNVEVRLCQNGIDIQNTSQGNFIVNCNIHNNSAEGLNIAGPQNLIYNNRVTANGGHNINMTTTSSANTLIGNFIKRGGRGGIESFSTADFIIGNSLKNNAQNGMFLASSNDIVYNNRVKRSILDGIDIVVAGQNRIISNTVKNNTNSGIALSSSNVADENNVKNNRIGIFMSIGSDNNAVRRNNLRNTNNIINLGANNVIDEND